MPLTLRALLASVLALPALALPTFATAGPTAAPTPAAIAAATQAELAPFLQQKLDWGPCQPFARTPDDTVTFADAKYDCTYLEVPIDYAHPDGKRAKIAMLRQKASDQAHRIGSLFTDPGGPGASGVSFLPSLARGLADSDLTRRFDLIGFDPRGVGASEPSIDCSTTAEVDAERAEDTVDTSPAGVARTESQYRDFAQRCAQRVGLDVLANVGTRDVARDLHLASLVVGDPALNYVGYSYGTAIGTEYAEQFPTAVRAMVLDGAVDPSLGPVESRTTQERGFQRAFDNFATSCAQQADCPLGADPSRASARLQQILRPLITRPLGADANGRTLDYNDAMTGVVDALYSDSLWPYLADGLTQVTVGAGDKLLRLADSYYERNPDGSYPNLNEAFRAVTCADTQPLTDRAQARQVSSEVLRLAPFEDAGTGPSDALDQCSFWPVPPTSTAGRVVAPGLPTVLVVSSTGDPATPYEDGVSLAGQLGARLLTVENDSHTVALQGTNACADDITIHYLVDVSLPAHDTRCVATNAS